MILVTWSVYVFYGIFHCLNSNVHAIVYPVVALVVFLCTLVNVVSSAAVVSVSWLLCTYSFPFLTQLLGCPSLFGFL